MEPCSELDRKNGFHRWTRAEGDSESASNPFACGFCIVFWILCVCLCVWVWAHACRSRCLAVTGQTWCWPSPPASFAIVYTGLARQLASQDSLVSTSYLALGTLGLQMCVITSGFMCIQGIWTQILVLSQQALDPLSHLLSPTWLLSPIWLAVRQKQSGWWAMRLGGREGCYGRGVCVT